MASEHVMEVTDDTFQEKVVNASDLVIVDFWADWCGPCKKIGPVLDEVANDLGGKVKIAKVDVQKSTGVASNFGIRSIPTLIFFNGGELVDTVVGAVSKKDILERVNKIIG